MLTQRSQILSEIRSIIADMQFLVTLKFVYSEKATKFCEIETLKKSNTDRKGVNVTKNCKSAIMLLISERI